MRATTTLLCLAALLAGCTMLPAPDSSLIDRKPVAQLGDAKPAKPDDYILRIPAGKPVPVRLSLSGGLFEDNENIESEIRLAHDLYLYKYWASHDGRAWKKWNELVGVQVSSGVGTEGATFKVKVDEKAGSK
jgi:hypothetical protein